MSACAGLGIDNLLRRHHGRGSADPRRLGGVLRVPAAERRHRTAEGAASRFIRVTQAGRGARGRGRRRSSGRGWSRTTASSSASRSTSTIRSSTRPASASSSTWAAGSYSRDIARARTFGFTKDVEMMRSQRPGAGRRPRQRDRDGRLPRCSTASGLRYDDEFVKHKILDAMGDLYVIGQPLLAAYSAFRSGHALNNKLLRELLARRRCLRDRHLRRRGDGAGRPRRAGARVVSRALAGLRLSHDDGIAARWW